MPSREMHLLDTHCHFQYLCILKETIDFLLSLVGPLLVRRGYFSRQQAEITQLA